jgi:N-acetylglucosaminyl-diphospho-decaprenol L-rhamnosyltransferase
MNLSVIIVNYRTAELTINCIASIAADRFSGESINVVLVDNASPDNSAKVLEQAIQLNGWASWVDFIPASSNGGFAYGNNLGIRFAINSPSPPEYLLLLNPDTIVRPGALVRLCQFMDEHPKAGIAGAHIIGPEGLPLHCAHYFPSPSQQFAEGLRLGIVNRWLGSGSHSPGGSRDIECDWVSGACMLVRREVIEQIGEMDEEFFLYFEEVDYCWRAKTAIWEVWYVASAEVVHLIGASTAINSSAKRRPMYWYESRLRFFTKHYGGLRSILADAACCMGVLGFRIRNLFKRRPDITPKEYLRDILRCRFGIR